MELKLDTKHIFDLGTSISKQLIESGIEQQSELIIHVTKQQLLKIDEDLYYRGEHAEGEKFTPSNNELVVNFDKVAIKVRANE